MITLEKLNINEKELDEILTFIFEVEKPDEKKMYGKFIKEDATLDQKLLLLVDSKPLVSGAKFATAYRLIRAFGQKCRECNDSGKIWMRQKHMAECTVNEAKRILEAAKKINYDESSFVDEWQNKLETAQGKVSAYETKYGIEDTTEV